MSKSLGNVVAPQQVIEGQRRRRPAAVGVDGRLPRRSAARQGGARAHGRGVPQDPQHVPVPAVEPVRLRSGARPGAGRRDCSRSIGSRWRRTRGWRGRCCDAYDAYDFQAIFHAINEFVTVDLSAFYLDVSKDRLYTFRADSRERRSAQTALYVIADGLARLLAPILSVTADEIWLHLPGAREASVHLADFPAGRRRVARRRRSKRAGRALLEVRGRGQRARSKSRAQREDDRQRARRRTSRSRAAGDPLARLLDDARGRSADAVHRLVGRRRARRAGDALAVDGRARRRRQVSALLALRHRDGDGRRARGPVPALRGRGGRRRLLPPADDPAATPRQPASAPAADGAGGRRRGRASFQIFWWLSAWRSSSPIRSTKALVARDAAALRQPARSSRAWWISIHVHNAGVAFGLLNDATAAVQGLAHDGAGARSRWSASRFYARHIRPRGAARARSACR